MSARPELAPSAVALPLLWLRLLWLRLLWLRLLLLLLEHPLL